MEGCPEHLYVQLAAILQALVALRHHVSMIVLLYYYSGNCQIYVVLMTTSL